MQFAAEIKGVKLAPNKTVITLEVSPEHTGDIDGLQLLMQQTTLVTIEPIQMAINFEQA